MAESSKIEPSPQDETIEQVESIPTSEVKNVIDELVREIQTTLPIITIAKTPSYLALRASHSRRGVGAIYQTKKGAYLIATQLIDGKADYGLKLDIPADGLNKSQTTKIIKALGRYLKAREWIE